MICGQTNNHQPFGHPWSLHAVCQQAHLHEGMCRQRVEGYMIMWKPDLLSS